MTQYRKDRLENNHYYHVFSRSIAKYVVFNDGDEYSRFLEIFELYKYVNFNYQYSKFVRLDPLLQSQVIASLKKDNEVFVEIVAFCLMPTHIHFLLKQVVDQGISKFMGNILNCYSRYFNIKHRRTGHLWSDRFKSVLVQTDEQLRHLTRYIHLNPTSAGLVRNPKEWQYSSFGDYINEPSGTLINQNLFSISPKEYEKFVMDRKNYQQELSKIKHIVLDDYAG